MKKTIPIEDHFDQNDSARLIFLREDAHNGKIGFVFSTTEETAEDIFVRKDQLLTATSFVPMQEYSFNGFLDESAVVSLEKI